MDEAVIHHPSEWWWLKADGCDLVECLGESVRGVWSGDVDHNDGDLQAQQATYEKRLQSIADMKLTSSVDRQKILHQLDDTKDQLRNDFTFLHNSMLLQYHP